MTGYQIPREPHAPAEDCIAQILRRLDAIERVLGINLPPPVAPAEPQPLLMTVDEFCSKYRFGRTKYQDMKRRGETPEELRVGNRLLITSEAESAWLALKADQARRLKEDRFANGLPLTFPSGKKIGRPGKLQS